MRPLAQLDILNLDDLPRAVKARSDLDEHSPPSSGQVLAGLSFHQRQHEADCKSTSPWIKFGRAFFLA